MYLVRCNRCKVTVSCQKDGSKPEGWKTISPSQIHFPVELCPGCHDHLLLWLDNEPVP